MVNDMVSDMVSDMVCDMVSDMVSECPSVCWVAGSAVCSCKDPFCSWLCLLMLHMCTGAEDFARDV